MAATSSNRKRTYNRRSKKQQEVNKMKSEMIVLMIATVSLLLFLSNFGIVGMVGNEISKFMFGCIGFIAYLFPVVVVFASAFYHINRTNQLAVRKLIAGVSLFLILGIFISIFTEPMKDIATGSNSLSQILGNFYNNSSTEKNGGGLILSAVGYGMVICFDTIGTIILLFLLAIICIVFLTQKSLIRGIKQGGERAYKTAKEESVRHKERATIRREQLEQMRIERQSKMTELEVEKEIPKKKLRMERKASGVILDTKIVDTNVPVQAVVKNNHYDMHEYILPETKEIDENSFVQQTMEQPQSHPITPKRIPTVHREEQTPIIQQKQQVQSNTQTQPRNPNIGRKNLSNQSYQFPPLQLLKPSNTTSNRDTTKLLQETARQLEQTLLTFGVKVAVTDVRQGPSVTRYELQPELGVKVSKIVGLADDIKLNLAATDIRIEAPIPGKAAVGIEVPNRETSLVALRDLFETKSFKDFESNLGFAVGKDISGKVVVSDIAKMPHMLVAGATGSGKSVCINTLIMSILYKAHPDDVKMIMIDPKVVELSVYNGIPHLLIPVVTDPKKASAALQWGVAEMTDRYKKFADQNVRDLKGYNEKVKADPSLKMPQVIIIVDELADLMMVSPGEVEESICRLAQLARAAGIHLIIATQRPSVDVITGLIKANMPSRIAFSVSSGVDSRTILDMNGAEKLLGKGDMLFYPQGYSKPARVQGAFVSDSEVSDVVDFLKNQAIGNVYNEQITMKIDEATSSESSSGNGLTGSGKEYDPYFQDAARFIIEKDKASIGMLQRVFKIGFNRAARIMDQLAEEGIVGEEEGTKPRKVLMSLSEFEQYILEDEK